MLMTWRKFTQSHIYYPTTQMGMFHLFVSPQRTKSDSTIRKFKKIIRETNGFVAANEKKTSPKKHREKWKTSSKAMLGVHCTIESSHFFFTCFVRGIQKPSSRKHHQKRRFYFKYAISVKTQKMHKKMSMCSPKVNPPWDVFPETRHQNPPHGSTNKFQQFPKAPMPKVIVRIQYLRKSPERSPRGVRSIGQIGVLFFGASGGMKNWHRIQFVHTKFRWYCRHTKYFFLSWVSFFQVQQELESGAETTWCTGTLAIICTQTTTTSLSTSNRNIMTEFLLAWEWQ